MSSGIKGNFGTFMKAGQVGAATSKGIAAARLAAAGVTANRDVFSGEHSFPKVFNGDETVDWSSLAELGTRWTMESPGLVFKLHPCCGSTHAAIDATLGMRSDGDIDPATIESIDIYLHPRRLPHIDRPYPGTGLAAKFSLQYVTSLAALHGAVRVDDFAEDHFPASDVRRLLPHVRLHALPEDEQELGGRIDCFASKVEVVDRRGRHQRSLALPRGSDPLLPVTDSDLETKFVDNATIAVGSDAAHQSLAMVQAWDAGVLPLGELTGFLQEHVLKSLQWRVTEQDQLLPSRGS